MGEMYVRTDCGSQRRRSMLGKIHVARKQLEPLGLDEDSYRELLFNTTGKISLTQCTDAQLAEVIDTLKAKGFRSLPSSAGKSAAQHPLARKARAMWISLHQLGVIHHPGEPALEAFAKKTLHCDRLAWAKQSHGPVMIEALKNMAERHGWKQTDHKGKPLGRLGLQESLCKAIVQRLKDIDEIPDEWSLDVTAMRLCGIKTACMAPFTVEQYHNLATALGAILRPALARVGATI